MKVDTSGIDPDPLGRAVREAYGLEIESVAFLPKGEASYAYLAADRGGARWLIKLQDPARRADLEVRLRAMRYLYAVRGFTRMRQKLITPSPSCSLIYPPRTRKWMPPSGRSQ